MKKYIQTQTKTHQIYPADSMLDSASTTTVNEFRSNDSNRMTVGGDDE